MKLEEGVQVDIVDARWVSGYILDLSFSDGFSRSIDFESFLSESMHPEIRAYLDVEKFKAFSIHFGNLVWNDYTLCFPLEDLYFGRIGVGDKSQRMVAESISGYCAGCEGGE